MVKLLDKLGENETLPGQYAKPVRQVAGQKVLDDSELASFNLAEKQRRWLDLSRRLRGYLSDSELAAERKKFFES